MKHGAKLSLEITGITFAGFLFYLLGMSGSVAILGIILFSYLEVIRQD